MRNYIIRVEPAVADQTTYAALTAALAQYNVSNSVRADDGAGYLLGTGDFCYGGEETIEKVRDAVFRIASSVTPEPKVLVTEVVNVSWIGLAKLEAQAAE